MLLYVLLPSSLHFNRHSGMFVCWLSRFSLSTCSLRSSGVDFHVQKWIVQLFEKKNGAAGCGIQFLFLAAHTHTRKKRNSL